MPEPKGPPFTVPRYGSLGASIIAERDWLKEENTQLRGVLSLAEEGLANYQQELEAIKRTREQERDYADVCYALQRATEKLQELADECAACAGSGIIKPDVAWADTGTQECTECHDIRLVIALCLPLPQTPPHAAEQDVK